MEALTGCSIAALNIYDMCKSIKQEIRIENLELIGKFGGKSGNFGSVDFLNNNYFSLL